MRAVQGELGALSSRIQEDLGAIQVIKTYGLEDVRRTGFVERQRAAARREHGRREGPHPARADRSTRSRALGMAILILFGGRA